jgi:hypothetical protein
MFLIEKYRLQRQNNRRGAENAEGRRGKGQNSKVKFKKLTLF